MIFRRIKAHIEKENWFAVLVDFLIVVVGVFIGIQVANWNEERKATHSEQALIARLADEFQVLAEKLDERATRAQGLTVSTSQLIDLVRGDERIEDDESIKKLLTDAIRFNAQVPLPTTFAEALQSGSIRELNNHELRQKLNEYQVSRSWWSTVDDMASPQLDPNSHLIRSLTMSTDNDTWNGEFFKVLSYDWEELSQAGHELSVIHRFQSFQLSGYKVETRAVAAVIAELEND
jgi:hypothetical protein